MKKQRELGASDYHEQAQWTTHLGREYETMICSAVKPNTMKDIPEMTVSKHHLLCVGALGMCYYFVPDKLKRAIYEAVDAASKMGMPVNADNLEKGLPLSTNDNN